jgi:hypothetical protein
MRDGRQTWSKCGELRCGSTAQKRRGSDGVRCKRLEQFLSVIFRTIECDIGSSGGGDGKLSSAEVARWAKTRHLGVHARS